MKKILFVVYGGGHVLLVLPVIKKLLKDSTILVEILAGTIARDILEKEGINCFSFRDLIVEGRDNHAKELGKSLAKDLPENSPLPLSESIAYLGLSFHDFKGLVGPEEALSLYQTEGRRPMLPFTAINRAIDRVAPDLIIATNSPRAEKAAILTAGYRGIKSVCIVDLFGIRELPWVGVPGYGTKVCLLSNHVKEIFKKFGRPDSEIIVTGNPLFDILAKEETKIRADLFRQERNWTKSRPVILWASPGFASNFPQYISIESFSEFALNHPEYDFIIRPHPNEKFPQTLQSTSNIYYSFQEDDINTVLSAVDVVVTMTSTVGVGAVIAQKPLICIDAGEYNNDAPYVKYGMAINCDNLSSLKDAIKSALKKDPIDISDLPVPGTATENIIQCIKNLINE